MLKTGKEPFRERASESTSASFPLRASLPQINPFVTQRGIMKSSRRLSSKSRARVFQNAPINVIYSDVRLTLTALFFGVSRRLTQFPRDFYECNAMSKFRRSFLSSARRNYDGREGEKNKKRLISSEWAQDDRLTQNFPSRCDIDVKC